MRSQYTLKLAIFSPWIPFEQLLFKTSQQQSKFTFNCHKIHPLFNKTLLSIHKLSSAVVLLSRAIDGNFLNFKARIWDISSNKFQSKQLKCSHFLPKNKSREILGKCDEQWRNRTRRVRHLIDLISVPAMIAIVSVALPAGWHIASIFSDTQQPLSVQLFSTKIWETFGELLRFPPFSIAMLKKSWILFAFHSVAYKNGGSWAASCQSASLYFCLKSDQVALGFSSNVWKGGSGSNIFYDKIWENPKILSQILYCRFYSFVTHPWNWNRVWNSKSFFGNENITFSTRHCKICKNTGNQKF